MRFLVSIFMFLLTFNSISFAQNFEGVISLTVESELKGEKTDIDWHKKGDNHRLEVTTSTKDMTISYVLIYKENDPNLHMLTDVGGEKNAYRVPLSKMNQPASDLSLGGAMPIGNHEETKLAGFACQILEVEGPMAKAKYWLTTDFNISLEEFAPLLQTANYFKYLKRKNVKGVPIKIESADLDGIVQYRQTIHSIKPGKVDKAMFDIPAEYELK